MNSQHSKSNDDDNLGNDDNKRTQNAAGITTYPHRSNIPFIKYFDNKAVNNSTK